MENYYLIFMCIFVYIILYIRYYLFRFPSDKTIFIEDQKIKYIRKDDRLTIYEYPPSKYKNNSGTILTENKIHRSFYSRIFYCNIKPEMQLNIFVIPPDQTIYLYPNTHLMRLKQSSPVNILEPDLNKFKQFKKCQYIEIPIVGEQMFYIPRGWWMFCDSPSSLIEKNI